MRQNYRLELMPDPLDECLSESIDELSEYRGQSIIDDVLSVNDDYIDRAIDFIKQIYGKFGILLNPGFSDINFFGGVLIDIVRDSDNYICVDLTADEIYIQTKHHGSIDRELSTENGIELPADSLPDILVTAIEKVIM